MVLFPFVGSDPEDSRYQFLSGNHLVQEVNYLRDQHSPASIYSLRWILLGPDHNEISLFFNLGIE